MRALRWMLTIMVLVFFGTGLCPFQPAHAQETSPQAGTWGAETGLSQGVSLLRFRSTTSAWLVGFDAVHYNRDDDGNQDQRLTMAEVRLGMRSYRNPQERVRPFTGLSALVGYDENPLDQGTWAFGAAAEFGAAYFFSRHVSLGTALDLSARYAKGERDDFVTGAPVDVTTITARAGLRFLGAVYF